jgi:peptidoglycan/LPS O-acetylase OafA/YrhL
MLALIFLAYSIVTFLAPVWDRRDVASRYSVMPAILLASALAVLLADPTRSRDTWVTRIGRPLFVAWVVGLTVIGFSITNYRSQDPTWSNSVTLTYTTQCRHKPPDTIVEVRTDAYNAWPVALPCKDLMP